MKMTRLTLPFALFMMIGANAFGYGLSTEAVRAIDHIIRAQESPSRQVQQGYTNVNQTVNPANLRVAGTCPQHYPLGAPIVVSAQKDKVERRSFYLCRTGYAVQFDPATKTPLWSAEKLDAQLLQGAKDPRTDDFQPDPQVPAPAQASLADYRGSHFDRGHMSPAADQSGRPGNAMSESFYLTNMVPQVGPNQNRGIWADLEAQVRKWAEDRGEILVVTGPIFDQGTVAVGRSQVWVPTRLYKVAIDPKTLESIAFIIPNRQVVTRKTRKLDEGNPNYPQTTPEQAVNCNGGPCTPTSFAVPVSAVEQATGLRFFSALNEQQHQIATTGIARSWRFR